MLCHAFFPKEHLPLHFLPCLIKINFATNSKYLIAFAGRQNTADLPKANQLMKTINAKERRALASFAERV